MNLSMVVFLVITFSLSSSQLWAAEISGVRFAETYQDQGVVLKLRGTGLKTAFFFNAFAAGYYSADGANSYELARFPKRIEVEYFVNIPKRKLSAYTIEQMKENVSDTEFDQIRAQVKLMEDFFVDLKSGDRFSLTYLPGVGTKFAHNDQLTGIIQGEDFARALFAVWLGEKPFDRQLKTQICGEAKVS